MGGERDSSLTRVQPVFGAALERDPTGADWLPALLAAAGGRGSLGALADHPGLLGPVTVEPSPSRKADLACFEVQVLPDRRLLSWCVEHPEQLKPPSASEDPEETERLRRSLICDDPPGSRPDVQRRASECVDTAPVDYRAWWRFERQTEVDCVLATDRLVVCIEGKRGERLQRSTTWLAGRNQAARNLEAAWRVAGAKRAFAVLVCVEDPNDPVADPAFVRKSLKVSSPHLSTAERAALADAYLGQLTWIEVCRTLGLDPSGMPETVADVPGCRAKLLGQEPNR